MYLNKADNVLICAITDPCYQVTSGTVVGLIIRTYSTHCQLKKLTVSYQR